MAVKRMEKVQPLYDSLVVGLGLTGLSCVRFLVKQGHRVAVVDSRANPPGLAELQEQFPEIPVALGAFDADLLCQAGQLVMSPGVALAEPAIQRAITAGVGITSDIDLFCEQVEAPVIAITGSNAKSTVTALVGEMAKAAGLKTAVAGNIGLPVLDLLAEADFDLYVLELSSFQLEVTHKLAAQVAVILNLSEDHLDRYQDIKAYHRAKKRILAGAHHVVNNLDQPGLPDPVAAERCWNFGHCQPQRERDFGITSVAGEPWLARGRQPLLAVADLKIKGRHNQSNALAALAIAAAAGLDEASSLTALKNFAGLQHRCQWVAEKAGIQYYNDSKGTNTGATIAAIEGLAEEGHRNLVLIAGGQGKGADFTVMQPVLQRCVHSLVLMGEAADEMTADFAAIPGLTILQADSMADAVLQATKAARAGDIVLLSPACASFDMFRGYAHRGDCFVSEVEAL